MVTSDDVQRTKQRATDAVEKGKQLREKVREYARGYLDGPEYVDADMLKQAIDDYETALAKAETLVSEHEETVIRWYEVDPKVRR